MFKTFTLDKVSSIDNLKEQLSTLSQKINTIGKEISYLDLYNIVEAIEEKDQFQNKINFLPPNSAAVINAPNFSIDDVQYKTGDVMLRNNSGDLIHIKAQAGGVYYPAQILKDKEGQYQIIFQYAESIVDGALETEVAEQKTENIVDKAYKKILFTGFETNDEDATIYGHVFNITTEKVINFDAVELNEQTVRPVIKFYFENTNGREEVFIDYTIVLIENNYTITWSDDFIGVVVVK